jgi:hypothetical protein
LCRDGTYATVRIQTFVGDEYNWDPYCTPCGEAFASVIKDGQKREVEVRRLAPPPDGKAPQEPKPARKVAEPPAPKGKPAKGKAVVSTAVAPPVPPVVAEPEKPRMTLMEAMRRTAPPAPPPVPPPPKPVKSRSAREALREAAFEVEGYDLLSMLGMKR